MGCRFITIGYPTQVAHQPTNTKRCFYRVRIKKSAGVSTPAQLFIVSWD